MRGVLKKYQLKNIHLSWFVRSFVRIPFASVMDFSLRFGSLIGFLLIEETLKTGAICKEDQSRICRSIDEGGGYSSAAHLHPNAGTCFQKRYSPFTHICSVNDYSPSVAFCCCSTHRTQATMPSHGASIEDKSSQTILCCRYFQSWNTFRCDEERDAVPPLAHSNLASVRVWTISLILLAAISLITLLLIGCIRKALTSRKKGLSDNKPDRLSSTSAIPSHLEMQKHFHHPQSPFCQNCSLDCNKSSVAPLIPSAPTIEDDDSYKEIFQPASEFSEQERRCVRCGHDNRNYIGSSSNNSNNDKSKNTITDDAYRSRATESTTTTSTNLFDSYRSDDPCPENVEMSDRGALRDSVFVEEDIGTNNEPPPPYDEVFRCRD